MTFLTLFVLAAAAASQAPVCSLPPGSLGKGRMFTNADLDRMAACRYQTGAQSEPAALRRTAARPSQAPRNRLTQSRTGEESREADWRAQWRKLDQRTGKLKRQARELRQEANETPRNPKSQPSGRRLPSLLLSRAKSLDAEAKEIEDEFQERARREGALPGWLRPQGR